MKYIFNITLLLSVLLGFSACATQRKATQSATSTAPKTSDVAAEKCLRFLQRVNDNRLYQKNLVASLTATIVTDGKDISVPGSLHMRKDEVIRLQLFLPFLGTEVGRIEFTPTEVLVIDRIHKEYIQADYTQLRFLRDNNLTFYSLQALFWNQLLIPGKQQVGETDLSRFNVELSETGQQKITISAGAIAYCWEQERQEFGPHQSVASIVSRPDQWPDNVGLAIQSVPPVWLETISHAPSGHVYHCCHQ